MSSAPTHSHHSLTRGTAPLSGETGSDHTLADRAVVARDFACLAGVTHLTLAGMLELRRVGGVTEIIDDNDTAEVHLMVRCASAHDARRIVVELVTTAVPDAVVAVADVVDYEAALADHVDSPGARALVDETLDDVMAIALVLDR